MKNKIQHLINAGLSKKLLTNLSEGQVNQLHKRMVSEQPQSGITMVPAEDSEKQTQLKQQKKTYQVYEKEIDEDDTLDVVKDPDATEDGMGMFETEIGEGKKKESKYNPWAICTSSVGRKDKKKYEKCVMDVKKNIKEGKNPHQVIVEMALEKMIEKHISPRMTKKDLIDTLTESGIIRRPMTNMVLGFADEKKMDKPVKKSYTSSMKESDTKTAPPKIKPGTKEKPGTLDPFKNPKHQPKPKAEVKESDTKTAPPKIKPGTKEKPGTSDPFKNPKHQPKPKALDQPAKKMGTVEIPDYLTFDQLKINFKDQ
jgi:hypothetical protein